MHGQDADAVVPRAGGNQVGRVGGLDASGAHVLQMPHERRGARIAPAVELQRQLEEAGQVADRLRAGFARQRGPVAPQCIGLEVHPVQQVVGGDAPDQLPPPLQVFGGAAQGMGRVGAGGALQPLVPGAAARRRQRHQIPVAGAVQGRAERLRQAQVVGGVGQDPEQGQQVQHLQVVEQGLAGLAGEGDALPGQLALDLRQVGAGAHQNQDVAVAEPARAARLGVLDADAGIEQRPDARRELAGPLGGLVAAALGPGRGQGVAQPVPVRLRDG